MSSFMFEHAVVSKEFKRAYVRADRNLLYPFDDLDQISVLKNVFFRYLPFSFQCELVMTQKIVIMKLFLDMQAPWMARKRNSI